MLHILVNSPFKVEWKIIMNMLHPVDAFIGIQDGVLIGLQDNVFLKKILKFQIKLYLLKEDVISRGIIRHISKRFHLINYVQFVLLTEQYNKFFNW
ncbi:sulfurtransferase complex subunit TusB [Buchnera aphidicola]|uniref:Sulfurtransferase complex subunit TusB n=1 Tax=Buchnera aphidicola (Stegophylla sp.) TaxID=2315800 RepID=A0A4D6YBK6_9GAMM|nr:sulfurtransferase complex subunit TusB [Buchnera aphidicola (Stegophylla sp.)]QCI26492.1 sulfurtransferase complex subunit TusB [Buchnera aphidicola (Stegophylla sp.)]